MNRPFQLVVGSQSSALIFESKLGVSSSFTRQYSGRGGGAAAGGAAGAARPVAGAGAAAGAPRPPRPADGGGVTTSAAEMVTLGIDIDRRLSQVAVPEAAKDVAADDVAGANSTKPRLPTSALNLMFMVYAPTTSD